MVVVVASCCGAAFADCSAKYTKCKHKYKYKEGVYVPVFSRTAMFNDFLLFVLKNILGKPRLSSYLQVRLRFLSNLTLSSLKSVPPSREPEWGEISRQNCFTSVQQFSNVSHVGWQEQEANFSPQWPSQDWAGRGRWTDKSRQSWYVHSPGILIHCQK